MRSSNMNRRPTLWAGIGLAGVAVGALLWALWPPAGSDDTTGQGPVADEQAPLLVDAPASGAPQDATVSISAVELARQYESSRTMVDGQYRHRWLRLTGQVESVESSQAGVTVVSLSTGDDLPPLGVVMAASQQEVARAWGPGHAAALRCLHHGLLMGRPVLAECQVVSGG